MGRTTLGPLLAGCVLFVATGADAERVAKEGKVPVVDASPPGMPDATVNFNLNLAGLLQFGPVAAVEFGRHTAFHVRLRLMNVGVASYFIGFDRPEEWFSWGFGTGVGVRHYFARDGHMRGFYLGAGVEGIFTGWGRTVDEAGTGNTVDVAETSHFVAPTFDLGYRFVTGTGLLWSFGGTAGWAIVVDSSYANEVDVFVGMLAVELGWFL